MTGRGPSRRAVLQGLGAGLGAAALGCGTDVDGARPGADAGAGPDGRAGALDAGAPPDDAARADRCSGPSELTAEQLLAPIDTIVVLMMENRSFDHYLGARALVEGRPLDGLTGAESNPAPDGSPVQVHRLDDFTPADPPHGWSDCHDQWNGGANDGFVRAHAGPSQTDVMGYHVREHLPALWAMADHFTVCDRWFCSVLGPTWPNRFYLHGATSNGVKTNLPALGFRSIFDVLDEAGLSSRNYYHDLAWASGGYLRLAGLSPVEQFFDDAAAGALPAFSIIDPMFVAAGANDDHPDHDIRLGQALMATVYAALAASPQWSRCLFVITYDEHGGFYDHVAPPVTVDADPEHAQLGFRVPALVIGPHVKAGCTVSTVLEHVSVLSTLSRRHALPALNARAAATADLSSCIDPARLDAPRPGPALPPVEVSLRGLRARPPGHAHHELTALADAGRIPRRFDRRGEGLQVTERVLSWGDRLGAVRVRR